jgi:DNA-binding transcriptional ArsR family regulator
METKTELQLNDALIRKGKTVLRAVNHSLRLQMLYLIHRNKRMMVTDIYVALDLPQPVASQHLAILRQAQIVLVQRDGQRVYYAVNYQRLKDVDLLTSQLAAKD